MSINRQALLAHCLFHPRYGGQPTAEERAAFERVALNESQPLTRWLEVGDGKSVAAADILEMRGQLKSFHDATLQRARKLNDDIRAGKASATMGAACEDLIAAGRAAQRAIEACNGSLSLLDARPLASAAGGALGYSGQRSAGQAGASGQGAVEIRSGADWAEHFSQMAEPDTRDAFEQGEFGIDDFCRAIAGMRSSDVARRALSLGTDSAGGFTVPTILMPEILDALVPASSLMMAGAQIVRVDSESDGAKSLNWAAVQTLPVAAWRSENGVVAESDPVFRNVLAVPRSLAFMFKVSRELLGDANGLREALNRAIGAAFARELDRAGLRGTGTAPEPRGISNTAGIQAVGNGANGASQATLRWANLMTAYQSILAADAPQPTAAIMSPRSLIGFGNLADTTNQPLQRPVPLVPLQFLATSAVPNTLTVGTSTDCTEVYVGDFTGVKFVMREQPSIQLLTERFADNGQIGFMCHVRADVIVPYAAQLAVVTGLRP